MLDLLSLESHSISSIKLTFTFSTITGALEGRQGKKRPYLESEFSCFSDQIILSIILTVI